MAIPHAQSGQIADITPLGASLTGAKTTALIKSSNVEVIRLVVPADKDIPEHTAPGDITVQCLEGEVDFTAEGKTQRLKPGQLLFLAVRSPHSLRGVQDSSVLVTILLH